MEPSSQPTSWLVTAVPLKLHPSRSHLRLSTAGWCDSLLACVRRSPRRGEAQEGYAQLEVALPSSPCPLWSERGATALRLGLVWWSTGYESVLVVDPCGSERLGGEVVQGS